MLCDNRVSDMKVLESLSVDEYYMTLTTWMKILDDKVKAQGGDDKASNNNDGKERRKLKPK
mgnify:CR=1 FL=1